MRSAIGLRHPASASCLGRHSRLAGRCPNNSSLFPPLAAVVVVALWAYSAEKLFYILQFWKICGFSRIAFSREGSWREAAAAALVSFGNSRAAGSRLALSVTAYAVPPLPKGEALAKPETLPLCQRPHPRGGCRRRRLGEFRQEPLPSSPAAMPPSPRGRLLAAAAKFPALP